MQPKKVVLTSFTYKEIFIIEVANDNAFNNLHIIQVPNFQHFLLREIILEGDREEGRIMIMFMSS